MFFSDEFIEKIKGDPVTGVVDICNMAIDYVNRQPEWTQESHEVLQEALALILEMHESELIRVGISPPRQDDSFQADSQYIISFIQDVLKEFTAEASQLRLQSFRSHFRTSLGNSFAYEFSQGDLNRIQELINNLREMISKSDLFEHEHQQRLLRRLEKIQSELHKKVSDLDRFWGLVGDAGIVIGKFGNDAKPICDRIVEIANIVWRTQSRAEELPSDSPMPFLEHKQNSDGKKV